MTLWDALSVVCLTAASVPSVYLAGRLWYSRPLFARISALLAAAFMVHAVYHLMIVYGYPPTLIRGSEAASAVLMLSFSLSYWRQRRNGKGRKGGEVNG
ncbi:MAG TPA: hypothetical protein VI893_05195 [Thermoplasmata archaeon]|nr:hypothetical protein [Thermoplasmata archaeon]